MDFSQRSICFNFKNFDLCKFGNKCKYAHIKDQNATPDSQQNTFFKRVEGVIGVNEGSQECSQAGSSAPCSTSSIPAASSTSVSISRGSRTLVCNSFRSMLAKSGMRVKPSHKL